MNKFGISFVGDFSRMLKTPRGFVPAVLSLGSDTERTFCETSVWKPEDYLLHWRTAARACVDSREHPVFCSSLGRKRAELWAGVMTANGIVIGNFICDAPDYRVEAHRIVPAKSLLELFEETPEAKVSKWEIPFASVEALARDYGGDAPN